MSFTCSAWKSSEGEYVIISWDCGTPDQVSLTIDSGYGRITAPLPDSGTRSVPIEKSKVITTLTLKAVYGTTVKTWKKRVLVKNQKVLKGEKVYGSVSGNSSNDRSSKKIFTSASRPSSSAGSWWDNIRDSVCDFFKRLSYRWKMLPQRRRRFYTIVLVVLVFLWLDILFQSLRISSAQRQIRQVERQQVEMTI